MVKKEHIEAIANRQKSDLQIDDRTPWAVKIQFGNAEISVVVPGPRAKTCYCRVRDVSIPSEYCYEDTKANWENFSENWVVNLFNKIIHDDI